MKRLIIIILCCALILLACAKEQAIPKSSQLTEITPGERIAQHIKVLSDKELEGRRAGSRGEAKAALYLARYFQKAGLKPIGDLDTYFQSFPISGYEPVMVEGRMTFRQGSGGTASAENILGLWPGKEPGYIVISAHYDHLGIIDKQLYPGANDNASGVAALLELIKQLQGEKTKYNIIFALWSAEEEGFWGSEYFCSKPPVPLEDIKAVVNLDSIGNIKKTGEIMGWSAGENEFSSQILQKLEENGWQITWGNTDRHNSDQISFNKKGVAGFTLISPYWLEQNHTPEDMAGKIRTQPIEILVLALKKALI